MLGWDECDSSEWFSGDTAFTSLKYSAIYYPKHKLTMTILYLPEVDTWEDNDEWDEPHF